MGIMSRRRQAAESKVLGAHAPHEINEPDQVQAPEPAVETEAPAEEVEAPKSSKGSRKRKE